MYNEMAKHGMQAYFIKSGACFVLCREVDPIRDIGESNYCLGDPEECSWFADKCNAVDLGIVEDIPEECLLVNKTEGLTVDRLVLVKYGVG
jgi:hypothetical protein